MKKLVLLAGIWFVAANFASAQTSSGNEAPKMLNNLKTICQLTSPQMAKLQPIVQRHADVLKADQQKLTGAELKKADATENVNFEGKLKGILTNTQMASYENSLK